MADEKKQMRILIMDDDRSLLDALRHMLEEHEHEVHTVDNAKDAVTKVSETDFDIVMADYRMPGEDGIWFMKNANLKRSTKVLLCTAYANREVIKQMFELGACGYLIKPFDEEEVLRNLEFHGG
ncbi:MAG: response regulator [Kiritimatiellia bacterium]|jgi:DNA-binding NtrC family response regulator|nr:response regulator [Kiritimatiellia bacterium]MDP6629803.1 response regulator [Kiritimatiellia bacterium]MDP6809773.1 response regulator [Kiritimatiellia bacterium]MDP7025117.1 response regulator [Kiritimatiellia bacterium]